MTEDQERETKTDRTIGSMNGLWAILLKISLAMMPLAFMWAAWITSEVYAGRSFRLLGDRFSALDWEVGRRDIEREQEIKRMADRGRWEVAVARLDAVIDALPPIDWQDRIRVLEKNQDDIRANQAKIISILESMQKGTVNP